TSRLLFFESAMLPVVALKAVRSHFEMCQRKGLFVLLVLGLTLSLDAGRARGNGRRRDRAGRAPETTQLCATRQRPARTSAVRHRTPRGSPRLCDAALRATPPPGPATTRAVPPPTARPRGLAGWHTPRGPRAGRGPRPIPAPSLPPAPLR